MMKSPRSVGITITGRCNLACRHCFYANPMREYEDLPTSRWVDFIRECGDAAVMDIGFTGGEPFLREDIFELIDEVVKNRMKLKFISNGTLIDDFAAGKLADTGRVQFVQVSIDGDREHHDWIRGNGMYDLAMKGIEHLRVHGITVIVSVTLTKPDVPLKHTLFRLRELGVKEVGINAAESIGGWKGRKSILSNDLKDIEFRRKMDELDNLMDEFSDIVTHTPRPKMEQAAEIQPGTKSCGIGEKSLAVRHDGAYLACSMFFGRPLGWIGEDRLVDIWQNHPFLQKLRDGSISGKRCIAIEYFESPEKFQDK